MTFGEITQVRDHPMRAGERKHGVKSTVKGYGCVCGFVFSGKDRSQVTEQFYEHVKDPKHADNQRKDVYDTGDLMPAQRNPFVPI